MVVVSPSFFYKGKDRLASFVNASTVASRVNVICKLSERKYSRTAIHVLYMCRTNDSGAFTDSAA
jgi:hypothetical protein